MIEEITTNKLNLLIIIFIIFMCGFGWGRWFAEKSIRKERIELERARLLVSVPMLPEQASKVFESLRILSELSDKDE